MTDPAKKKKWSLAAHKGHEAGVHGDRPSAFTDSELDKLLADSKDEMLVLWLEEECARRPKLRRAVKELVTSILSTCKCGLNGFKPGYRQVNCRAHGPFKQFFSAASQPILCPICSGVPTIYPKDAA